jgi:hypothetical protein
MTTWFNHTFLAARRIVGRHRNWFWREMQRSELHPAVKTLLERDYRPIYWQRLLLEWPHVSETDRERIAYTRDERSGEADRQTITTVGKYLSRHFDLPDHIIRDAVASYIGNVDSYRVLRTVDAMVNAVNTGPTSCMKWSCRDNLHCADGYERHPYAAYDPQYGWHMAVRISPQGDIVGRALLNNDPHSDALYWVRSFGYREGSSYSYTDEKLEAWLKEQGYVKYYAWHEDAQLACYKVNRNDFLGPYVDGDLHMARIEDRGDGLKMFLDSSGDYELRRQDGFAEETGRHTCPQCGDRCDVDDMHSIGYHGEDSACQSCIDNDYTYVTGRAGDTYYVSNDCAIEADGDWYDSGYLSRNDIVELSCGDYTHRDNAVLCEDDDQWYRNDDDSIVYCEYDNKHHHIDNCVYTLDNGWVHEDDAWQCEGSSNYYSDSTDFVTVDDLMYHPDHTPAQEELFEETTSTTKE